MSNGTYRTPEPDTYDLLRMTKKDGGERTPFGERVLRAAEAAGFTQSSLARAAGLAEGVLSKQMRQTQDKLSFTTLRRIRDLTGVRTDWLIWGEEPMIDADAMRNPVRAAMARANAHPYMHATYEIMMAVVDRFGSIAKGRGWSDQDWLETFHDVQKQRDAKHREALKARRTARSKARRDGPPTRAGRGTSVSRDVTEARAAAEEVLRKRPA